MIRSAVRRSDCLHVASQGGKLCFADRAGDRLLLSSSLILETHLLARLRGRPSACRLLRRTGSSKPVGRTAPHPVMPDRAIASLCGRMSKHDCQAIVLVLYVVRWTAVSESQADENRPGRLAPLFPQDRHVVVSTRRICALWLPKGGGPSP